MYKKCMKTHVDTCTMYVNASFCKGLYTCYMCEHVCM